MARLLDVYFEHRQVGQLIQKDGGQMVFEYASTWLDDPQRFAISHSLPLRAERFRQKECRGFFGGILPEQTNRSVIARILKISERNDFAMLERIGGECAGALTFVPEGKSALGGGHDYRRLGDDELAEVLRTLPTRPLLAGEQGIRLCLAGAQDKIAVRIDQDGRISLPLNYAPSTHVLKPTGVTWEGIVPNEAFCMALATAVGLRTAPTTAHRIGDIEYLLSERFDRTFDEHGQVRRLHQEDFCQAFGVPTETKYQAEGGPGLKDCFALLREASSAPAVDLLALLDAVTFNLLIGNNDAHAKNYSLRYGTDGAVRLAPLYDLVCTVYYPEIEQTFAMKLGGQTNFERLAAEHITRFARDSGLAPKLVTKRMTALAAHVLTTLQSMESQRDERARIANIIAARCNSLLARLTAV